MYYIYELWNPITNRPFYVGSGKDRKGIPRHDAHLKESIRYQDSGKLARGANLHKINTILQIINAGLKIDIRVVQVNLSKGQVDINETMLISKYGRKDLGTGILTNKAAGGEGNTEWSAEQKKAHSNKLKGRPSHAKGKKLGPYSFERKKVQKEKILIKKAGQTDVEKLIEHQNRSNAHKGKIPWNKGLTKDDPRVKKYADKKKGQSRPDLIGKKPWNKGINLKDNPDHLILKKQSASLKGRVAPNKGMVSPNKGRTYEEIYGPEKAAELKELRRLAKIKYWNEKP